VRSKQAVLWAMVVLASALSSKGRAVDASAVGDQELLSITGNSEFDAAVQRFKNNQLKKIVGGMEVAKDGAYPWQASLGVARIQDPAQAHYCGAVVYNAQWLLTAAHCIDRLKSNQVTVVVGTNHLSPETPRHGVRIALLHASFDRKTLRNDIALVQLSEPIEFDDRVGGIDLASAQTEDMLLADTTDDLIITGWGAEMERGPHAIDLRYAKETFIPRNICNQPLSYGNSITENMLCAGSRGKGTCDADSGGPLFLIRERPILFGLTSYAKGCAEPLKFDVFTRVAKYVNWISGCVASPNSRQCHRSDPARP
jgi:secreted trypsin-like serine protease